MTCKDRDRVGFVLPKRQLKLAWLHFSSVKNGQLVSVLAWVRSAKTGLAAKLGLGSFCQTELLAGLRGSGSFGQKNGSPTSVAWVRSAKTARACSVCRHA
jgi:hypothetical protein